MIQYLACKNIPEQNILDGDYSSLSTVWSNLPKLKSGHHQRATKVKKWEIKTIWATTWQNQQSACAPSEDSDQPEHPPSLISHRCPHEESLGP